MKIDTTAKFGKVASGVIRSATAQRSNVQNMIEFGMSFYNTHGQTEYLNRVVGTATKTKTLSVAQIKKYIKAHTNLKFGTMKNGEDGFSSGNKAEPRTVEPTVTWYEFEKTKVAPNASDTLKQLDGFIKRIQTNMDSDLGVLNHEESAAILKVLNSLSATLHQPLLTAAA